jgi:hypothetical protein
MVYQRMRIKQSRSNKESNVLAATTMKNMEQEGISNAD